MISSCTSWYSHVLRANENLITKIGVNIEVDGKLPKDRPERRWYRLNEQSSETAQDKPTPFLNGTKTKEEIVVRSYFSLKVVHLISRFSNLLKQTF